MSRELTLEEAENIVDNMYQNRWIECGIEDGNTIHMGYLDNLQYNELESASILLLRTEIRLQKENQSLKKQLEEYDRKLFITKNELNMRQKSIDNKLNQQKKFIDWLEENWNTTQDIWYIKILNKYKEIIGGKE